MVRIALACVASLQLAVATRAADEPEPIKGTVLRKAAEKAAAVIEKSQKVWYEKKQGCTSCHHQILPILVHEAARERGVAYDAVLGRDVVARSLAHLKGLDAIVQGYDYIDEVDEAWKLIAAHAAGIPSSASTSAAAQYLASAQRADGGWHTMDGRPPQSHGRVTATAISARAVQIYMPESFKGEKQAVLRRAGKWLLGVRPRTTEEGAFRLLGLHWAGAGKGACEDASKGLLARQGGDGGWAQMPGLPSDAYSTGEALYALHHGAGLAVDAPAYLGGLRFLMKSQEEDGSWLVQSRLNDIIPVSPDFFPSGFPHGRKNQFLSIMGTAWAALAILQAVPELPKTAAPPLRPDFRPPEKADWIDVALNGTAADLKRALDAWMRPTARTTRGTTALMLAARDLEKVLLLIDRGADVNAKAESGITALTVASRYHGNAEVIRLLLRKGARPNAARGEAVKHGASALFFAAASGDVRTARALLDARAAVDAEMRVLGTDRQTPLMTAALRGDTAMVEYLIRRGADPNWAGNEKIAVLHRSVVNNHAETVKALLAGGAKINKADSEGFTALHYAALTDYGDTVILKLLLAAGADRKLKDDKDRTALDLARHFKHKAAEAVLAAEGPPR